MKTRVRFAPALACALLALACAAARAGAQDSFVLDPSARSGAMGGAGVAVGWGGMLDVHANPALLALTRGITYSGARSVTPSGPYVLEQLDQSRFSAAFCGLAVTSVGRPIGRTSMANVNSEFFWPPLSDPVTFRSDEREKEKGAAISAAGLVDGVASLFGLGWPRLGAWGDVAWGRTWKSGESTSLLGGNAMLPSRDEGWYARFTAIGARHSSRSGGMRLEVAVARGELNRLSDAPGSLFAATFARETRHTGAAVRATWLGPSRAAPGAAWIGGFRGALGPPLDFTLAWDNEQDVYPVFRNDRRPDPALVTTGQSRGHVGAEFTTFRLLSARVGFVGDGDGGYSTPSWGLGLGLPLGALGEIRYDFASPSRWSAEPAEHRHSWMIRIDPVAAWPRATDSGR